MSHPLAACWALILRTTAVRSGSDAEGGDTDSGGLAVSAGSPLVVAARAVPPCPGSPGSWSRKAVMRPRRVSNSLSDEVRASMNDSLVRRGQGLHERFATVPGDSSN